ncbi:ABC transporter permease [Paenibacillus alkalitolerans]|uniref:ABC transporter permease n=1 Tax=Paenibacillus alkalitolerans TaxID=2799335 RepID=UPI0018F388A6|nr:ABC transporter permease [Paenibacillus alkalitolerans]
MLQTSVFGTAVYGIWLRDIKKYFRVRTQLLGALIRPLLWLVIMGGGLRPIVSNVQGVDYLHFIFAGIVSMTIIFSAMQSAVSVVWDREFGYLKEILVAPIPRVAIVIGKSLSAATTATLQGVITLVFLPVVGVPVAWWTIPVLIACMFLLSLVIAALGLAIAGRMTSFEGFGAIANFLLMPMFFLSGAIYPVDTVPLWLKPLIFINPLTYGVDLMREVLVSAGHFSVWVDCVVLFGIAAVLTGIAIPMYERE